MPITSRAPKLPMATSLASAPTNSITTLFTTCMHPSALAPEFQDPFRRQGRGRSIVVVECRRQCLLVDAMTPCMRVSHTSYLTPHTSHLTPHTFTRHTSHVTPHTPHLTPHTFTRHTSHITRYTSHINYLQVTSRFSLTHVLLVPIPPPLPHSLPFHQASHLHAPPKP